MFFTAANLCSTVSLLGLWGPPLWGVRETVGGYGLWELDGQLVVMLGCPDEASQTANCLKWAVIALVSNFLILIGSFVSVWSHRFDFFCITDKTT